MIRTERIGSFAFQHPHAMVLVLAVIGSEVDVPFAANAMQFRRPNRIAVRTETGSCPNTGAGVLADGSNGPGFANANALLAFAFAIIVEALVENHPGVRR